MRFIKIFTILIIPFSLSSKSLIADMRACSPDAGPIITTKTLPKKDQHIGHPLEITVEGIEGISEVSLLESLRGISFVEVLDGRGVFKMYLNYRIDNSSSEFVVVQATNKKGETRCRAFYVVDGSDNSET